MVMSQRTWWVLEGGNGPQYRASNRMESLAQNFTKLNSAPNPNDSDGNSPLDPPEKKTACCFVLFFPPVRSVLPF